MKANKLFSLVIYDDEVYFDISSEDDQCQNLSLKNGQVDIDSSTNTTGDDSEYKDYNFQEEAKVTGKQRRVAA